MSATSQLSAAKGNLCPAVTKVHTSGPPIDKKTKKPKLKKNGEPYGDVPKSYEMGFCPDEKCVHPAGGLQSHAEMNILNDLPQPTTTADVVVLNIS